jgi:hypothetical protein
MFAMTKGGTKKKISEIATLEKKFGGGKILTRIAIHILVKKGELLIWRKNGHFPHCALYCITLCLDARGLASFDKNHN